MSKTKFGGFTIVELFIVVVVIAILAAVSVVAYRGVQNRAHNAVVQNDLLNFGKKIHLIAAETGSLPAGGRLYSSYSVSDGADITTSPGGVSFSVARSSYAALSGSGVANFTYCTGPSLATGESSFVLSAMSVTGILFQYSTLRGAESRGTLELSGDRACQGIDYPRSLSYGYFTNSGGWQAWTN